MLHGFRQFLDCELRCRSNGPVGRVIAFLLDDTAWALRYVHVRLDVDGAGVSRLLPTAVLPDVEHFNGTLSACLTARELAHGHVLNEGDGYKAPSLHDEQALHDALHWRPYWEQAEAQTPGSLHDAALAVGASLSCGGEPFGRVHDLLLDTETWHVSALSMEMSGAAEGERLHLPPSFIREVSWDARHLDCDIRAAVLACAPTSALRAPDDEYFTRLQHHLAREHGMP
jgi:hypothetical protein